MKLPEKRKGMVDDEGKTVWLNEVDRGFNEAIDVIKEMNKEEEK